MKNCIIVIIWICVLYPAQILHAQKNELSIADYYGADTADATPAVMRALTACKKLKAKTLFFPKGTYHFYPDFAIEKFFFVSNNDEGLKRVVFPLFGFDGLTIDGRGSRFIFHGFENPFILSGSKNIRLQNFSVDYKRPFHSEGRIAAVYTDSLDLDISAQFPFRIVNDLLQFTDYPDPEADMLAKRNLGIYEYRGLLEFDTKKRETAYMVSDIGAYLTPLIAKSLGPSSVRIFRKGIKATVGNTFVFGFENRNHPCFTISDCSNIFIQNIIINHCGGMGIIGQRSRDITVDHCKITPSEGRMVSATGDATHFVNCSGNITLSNNLFENQLDDATNIHGIYVKMDRKISSNEVMVKLMHGQQLGFDFLKKGMQVELLHGTSMITYDTATVKEVQRINKQYSRVVFESKLPGEWRAGDALAALGNYPKVYIHDNIIRNNRARGILLNSRGKTVVENNYFHNAGAAILFEGDAHFWFEQGGVSDCNIRNNVFDNCMFGVWGKAVIDVNSGVVEDLTHSRYNRNISITGNTFNVFDDASLLNIYCVDSLLWKGNKITKTSTYPPARVGNKRYEVTYSDHINIDDK